MSAPRPCGVPITDGCTLRLLDEADAPELQALVEANRLYLARWLPWATAQTLEDCEEFIARSRELLLDNGGFQTAIDRDGVIIGMAGFPAVDWQSRSASLGYWLTESRQGEGTMTAAVRTLVDHALSTWELNRIEIRAAVENRRSRAIPERLGFTQEGTLRKAERVAGHYLDVAVYSMLSADWRS